MKTNIYAVAPGLRCGSAALNPEGGDHRDDVGGGLRSDARSLRLRADQSGDDELREVTGEAARPRAIRVNGVAPGPIWSPLQVLGDASQEKLQKFGSQTAFGRPGQPAELASLYVQLAAEDASFATGQIYGAAGGSGQP